MGNEVSQKYIKDEHPFASGAFGKVYRATEKSTGMLVAIKEQEVEAESSVINRELSILSRMDHENCMRLIETLYYKNKVYIVMPLASEGSLLSYLQQQFEQISFSTKIKLMRQIISGLKYIHGCKVIHRDLKCENILINSSNSGLQAIISDFGISRADPTAAPMTIAGTPMYAAPEVQSGLAYSYSADVWSLGTVLFRMLTNESAFRGMPEIFKCQWERGLLRGQDQCWVPLFASIFNRDPAKRPSLDEVDEFIVKVEQDRAKKHEMVVKRKVQKVGLVSALVFVLLCVGFAIVRRRK